MSELTGKFTKSVQPNLPDAKAVGEFTGKAMGNAVNAIENFFEGLREIAAGRENAGIAKVATSSRKVHAQTIQRQPGIAYADPVIEQMAEEAKGKPGKGKAKHALSRAAEGFKAGYTEARTNKATVKPAKAPGLAPT